MITLEVIVLTYWISSVHKGDKQVSISTIIVDSKANRHLPVGTWAVLGLVGVVPVVVVVPNVVNDVFSWFANLKLVDSPECSSSVLNWVTVHALNSPEKGALTWIWVVVVIWLALVLNIISRKVEDFWLNSTLRVRELVILVISCSWISPRTVLGPVSCKIWLNIQESSNQSIRCWRVSLVHNNESLTSLFKIDWHIEILDIFILNQFIVIPLINSDKGWWNDTVRSKVNCINVVQLDDNLINALSVWTHHSDKESASETSVSLERSVVNLAQVIVEQSVILGHTYGFHVRSRVVALVIVLEGTWSLGETAHLHVEVWVSLGRIHSDLVSCILLVVNDEVSVVVRGVVRIAPHHLAQLQVLVVSHRLHSEGRELVLVLRQRNQRGQGEVWHHPDVVVSVGVVIFVVLVVHDDLGVIRLRRLGCLWIVVPLRVELNLVVELSSPEDHGPLFCSAPVGVISVLVLNELCVELS